MAKNYYDIIIERLIIILKAEFKNQIKFFKTDNPEISQNSISLIEAGSENVKTWAPNIVVDKFSVSLILRHVWQKDQNRIEWLNRDLHKIECLILANRSDSETCWFNGLIDDVESTQIEKNDENNPIFFRRDLTFSCMIAYDYTEGTTAIGLTGQPIGLLLALTYSS